MRLSWLPLLSASSICRAMSALSADKTHKNADYPIKLQLSQLFFFLEGVLTVLVTAIDVDDIMSPSENVTGKKKTASIQMEHP